MIVDLFVAIDVVEDAIEVFLAGVGVSSPVEFTQEGFRVLGAAASASSGVFNADVLNSNMLVVAEKGEAFWQDDNGIAFDDVSLGYDCGHLIVDFGVIRVDNSGSSEGHHFDETENVGLFDVDES